MSTKPANYPPVTACHRTIHRINLPRLLQAALPGTWHDIFLQEKDKNLNLWPARRFRMCGQVRMFWMQEKMRDLLMRFALPAAANGNILIPQIHLQNS